ncbi:hypothetical protein A33Q_1595 [Indibacter alkaliphilus LW1]|jgi:hypothetical protein|uniref:Lipocalin-like domain-containing protein n=1 Tax=Indibacter alkaliphilus (strain CCUG 57479 / KCTC 22604 / LW1) TaxID=1189612 RepID=S2E6P8_INDAL|nr:lipocalin family protein [Indibacter alkaliphilus]EOZ97943.1 hypothetical protein A33Q_1595 [Indibacter alkaliphilus LW1]
MKLKISFLQVLAMSLLLVVFSCGEKDEPRLSPIVGTWAYSSYNLDIAINGQPIVQFLQAIGASAQEAQEAANEIKDEFFSDEDFEGTELIFDANGNYEIRQNGTLDESGTYELLENDTKLRLTSSEDVTDFTVRQLTNNRLGISFTEEESDDFFGIGLPVLVKVELELNFVK